MTNQDEDVLTRTGVLRTEFGRSWRFWHWLAKQFSGTSLGVIGVILSVSSAYIVHLNGKVTAQETKITVLETKVLPVLASGAQIGELRTNMSVLVSTVTSHENRLIRIEKNLDLDYLDEQQQRRDRRAKRLK